MDDYTRRHLAFHAAAAGELDTFLTDLPFVISADPDELVASVADAATSEAVAVADCYRVTHRHLRSRGRGERAAWLLLAAQRLGHRHLASPGAGLTQLAENSPWFPRWSKGLAKASTQTVARHGRMICALACATHGGDALVVSAGAGTEQLLVHDLATGEQRGSITVEGVAVNITALAAHSLPTGLLIACGDCDGSIWVFSSDQHIVVDAKTKPHDAVITSLAFAEDGGALLLISVDEMQHVRHTVLRGSTTMRLPTRVETDETSTGRFAITATGLDRANPAYPSYLSATVTEEGPILAMTAHSRYVHLVRPGRTTESTGTTRIGPLPRTVSAIQLGRERQQPVVVISTDHSLAVHDVATGAELHSLTLSGGYVSEGAVAVASVAGAPAVVFGDSRGDIRLWQLDRTGQPEAAVEPDAGQAWTTYPIVSVQSTATTHGSALLVAHNDNRLRGPDVVVNQDPNHVSGINMIDAMTGAVLRTVGCLEDHAGISDMVLIGEQLILASFGATELYEFSLNTGGQRRIETGRRNVCQLSTITVDGTRLIAVGTSRDATINLFDADSGELVLELPTPPKAAINVMDFFAVAHQIGAVVSYRDGTVLYLSLSEEGGSADITGDYPRPVTAVTCLPVRNGLLLATGDAAGGVQVRELYSGVQLCSLGTDTPVMDLSFTTDRGLAVATLAGLIVIDLRFLNPAAPQTE